MRYKDCTVDWNFMSLCFLSCFVHILRVMSLWRWSCSAVCLHCFFFDKYNTKYQFHLCSKTHFSHLLSTELVLFCIQTFSLFELMELSRGLINLKKNITARWIQLRPKRGDLRLCILPLDTTVYGCCQHVYLSFRAGLWLHQPTFCSLFEAIEKVMYSVCRRILTEAICESSYLLRKSMDGWTELPVSATMDWI